MLQIVRRPQLPEKARVFPTFGDPSWKLVCLWFVWPSVEDEAADPKSFEFSSSFEVSFKEYVQDDCYKPSILDLARSSSAEFVENFSAAKAISTATRRLTRRSTLRSTFIAQFARKHSKRRDLWLNTGSSFTRSQKREFCGRFQWFLIYDIFFSVQCPECPHISTCEFEMPEFNQKLDSFQYCRQGSIQQALQVGSS